MKVIERGFKPVKSIRPTWSRRVTCTDSGSQLKGCGAKLQVTYSDLYKTQNCACGEVEEFTTFCCPICGTETDIKGVHPGSRELGGKRPSEGERRALAQKWNKSLLQ